MTSQRLAHDKLRKILAIGARSQTPFGQRRPPWQTDFPDPWLRVPKCAVSRAIERLRDRRLTTAGPSLDSRDPAVGLDIARGPEEDVFYIQAGSAWRWPPSSGTGARDARPHIGLASRGV